MRHNADKTGTFGRRGSFWSARTTEATKALARRLSHMAMQSGAERIVDRAACGLSGGGVTYARCFDLPWYPLSVGVLGADLQARFLGRFTEDYNAPGIIVIRRPNEESFPGDSNTLVAWPVAGAENYVLQAGPCEYVLLPVEGGDAYVPDVQDYRTRWVVPIPRGVRPASIAVGSRRLIAGVDFTLQNGALIFREDPQDIFRGCDFLHCLAGWIDVPYFLDYTLAADYDRPATQALNAYLKRHRSAPALLLALADLAGRTVASRTLEIAERHQHCLGTRYRTVDNETFDIDYNHTAYSPGDVIDAGSVIGGGIRVADGRPGSGMWHRQFDWSGGLDLGRLCPFPGLTIPDAPVRFECAEQTGSIFHVRPHLQGSPVALARYWRWLKACDIRNGTSLNAVFAFDTVGQDLAVNGVDFYFQHLLGEKALIVALDARKLGARCRDRCLRFLEQERMQNTVTIILDQ